MQELQIKVVPHLIATLDTAMYTWEVRGYYLLV